MRGLVVLVLLLLGFVAQAKKPSKEEMDAAVDRVIQENKAEIEKLATERAQKLAQRMAWNRRVDGADFLGVRVYLKNGWRLRGDECDEQGRCPVNQQFGYGAELFLHPVGWLRLEAAVGGLASSIERQNTKSGLEYAARLGFNLLGIGGLSVGYVGQMEEFDVVRSEEVCVATLCGSKFVPAKDRQAQHGGEIAAWASLRGITARFAVDLFGRQVVDDQGAARLTLTPMGVITLVSPPAFGL